LQEEALAEKTSDTLKSLEQARNALKFNPAEAVGTAFFEETDELPFMAGWALARLVAWALFDQEESKRIPKDKRENKAARRRLRPRYAYKAGQLLLSHYIRDFYRKSMSSPHLLKESRRQPAMALMMYFETDEIAKGFTHSGRSLSSLYNEKNRRFELMCVYHVMDFLVRAQLSGRIEVCKVKIARYFVEKNELMGERWSPSRIEKTWNLYRAAAPYIYAFYPLLYDANDNTGASLKGKSITQEDWINRINHIAIRSIREECLGRVAFAADVLKSTGTRDVRLRDFRKVPRVTPLLREFSTEEQFCIETFDDKCPIKD
jgi:hypothetical protein